MNKIIGKEAETQEKLLKIHSKVDWVRFKTFIPQMKGEETKRIQVIEKVMNVLGLNVEEILKSKNTTTYKTKEMIVVRAEKESLIVELTGSWCATIHNFDNAKLIYKKLNDAFKEDTGKLFILSRIDLATDWLNATPETLLPYDGNKKFLWWNCKVETHRPRHVLESIYWKTQKWVLVAYRKDISLKVDKLAGKKIYERKLMEQHRDKPITRLELRFEKTESCEIFQKLLFEDKKFSDSEIVSFGYSEFAKKRTIKVNDGKKHRKNMENEENYETIFKKNGNELVPSDLHIDDEFFSKPNQKPVNQKQRMLSGLVNRARLEELTLPELQELVALAFSKRNESVSEGGSESEAEKRLEDQNGHLL